MRRKKPRHNIEQCPIYRLSGINTLAEILFTSVDKIQALSSEGKLAYREWEDDQSKPGKSRHIEAPRPDLKRIQRRLSNLLMRIEPPGFLFCPVKKRDFLSNAARHLGARCIWTIDIKSYFENTTRSSVKRLFAHDLQTALDIASHLANITTINGHLATGSPASPILAYWSNQDMWLEIEALCEKYHCIISVYMDDLTVSGEAVPSELRLNIKRIIGKYGFRAHKEKSYVSRPALVTGGIINGATLQLPHAFFQRRRAKLARLQEGSEDSQQIRNSLSGMATMIDMWRTRGRGPTGLIP